MHELAPRQEEAGFTRPRAHFIVSLFPRMLRAMLNEIGGPSSHRQFPSVRRIVAAYTVGAGIAGGDSDSEDICKWLFPCVDSETEAREINKYKTFTIENLPYSKEHCTV